MMGQGSRMLYECFSEVAIDSYERDSYERNITRSSISYLCVTFLCQDLKVMFIVNSNHVIKLKSHPSVHHHFNFFITPAFTVIIIEHYEWSVNRVPSGRIIELELQPINRGKRKQGRRIGGSGPGSETRNID